MWLLLMGGVATLLLCRYYNTQVALPMIMSAVMYMKVLPEVCSGVYDGGWCDGGMVWY